MPIADESLRAIYLQPGESVLVQQPAMIRTVLGSCVGITFSYRKLGLGGMCHPMLPSIANGTAGGLREHPSTRYVDFTIKDMASKFDVLGALRQDVEVKLFGGADVLPVSTSCSRATVGSLNCDAALRTLADEGFEVAAFSLGGRCGIHIQFHTGTGEVVLRRLASTLPGDLLSKGPQGSVQPGERVERPQK